MQSQDQGAVVMGRIHVDDKYVIVTRDDGTIREVLRHGEPWRVESRSLFPSNLVRAMANRIEELEELAGL